MYKLKKDGRTVRGKFFSTYDAARGHARKMIRKGASVDKNARSVLGWDKISRNPPSIRDFGYEVVRSKAIASPRRVVL